MEVKKNTTRRKKRVSIVDKKNDNPVLSKQEQETVLKNEIAELLMKAKTKSEQLTKLQREINSSGFRIFKTVQIALTRQVNTLITQKLINVKSESK